LLRFESQQSKTMGGGQAREERLKQNVQGKDVGPVTSSPDTTIKMIPENDQNRLGAAGRAQC